MKTGKKSVLKITRDTHLWKKGQKVYAQWNTGSLAVFVVGKYKGKGRWIKAWVHYPYGGKNNNNTQSFKGQANAIWLS